MKFNRIMKSSRVLSLMVFLFLLLGATAPPPHLKIQSPVYHPTSGGTGRFQAMGAYGHLPLYFEPNAGQASRGTRFISRGRGYGLYLNASEVTLALCHPEPAIARLAPHPRRSRVT